MEWFPPQAPKPPAIRKHSPRRLSASERQAVLEVLYESRFADQPPAQVFAKLLDEGRYLCSIRNLHRLLAERGESGERRLQRPKTPYPVPRLVARAPNEVWTWDITKLATGVKGVFLSLYVVLDLFSRFVVAWMVAGRENSALAKHLLTEAIAPWDRARAALCAPGPRAPMTARGFVGFLTELGVDPSHSRPRVSNDNPFSESQFKTLKCQPDFPGRFRDAEHARAWCAEFFDWYNHHHQPGAACRRSILERDRCRLLFLPHAGPVVCTSFDAFRRVAAGSRAVRSCTRAGDAEAAPKRPADSPRPA